MRASDIDPKISILMRKWGDIRTNAQRMERTLLNLMNNPHTTPEQMSQAAKLYTDVTLRLYETTKKVDDYLYKRAPDSELNKGVNDENQTR
jgi:hypothetical protein